VQWLARYIITAAARLHRAKRTGHPSRNERTNKNGRDEPSINVRFTPECVAKLFAALRARNNRILVDGDESTLRIVV
jgi:hypothetical protein